MCDYCKQDSKFLMIEPYGDGNIFAEICGNTFRVFDDEYPGFLTTRQINYCPMCGRRLDEC